MLPKKLSFVINLFAYGNFKCVDRFLRKKLSGLSIEFHYFIGLNILREHETLEL